jgi:hypothetical protein
MDLTIRGHAFVPASWMYKAPEELLPDNNGATGVVDFTFAMDVYGFASTIFAVSIQTLYFQRLCRC